MIETKEYKASNGKTYYLRHFTATEGDAIKNYMDAINGDPEKKNAFTMRVMPFVCVRDSAGNDNRLDSKILIDNHVPNVKVLHELINELLHWNFDFLSLGEICGCLNLRTEKVADNTPNTEMLVALLGALLTADEQPSTNSKRSTRIKTHTTFGKA